MTGAQNANTTELRCACVRVYMAAVVDLADLLCAEAAWMSCRVKEASPLSIIKKRLLFATVVVPKLHLSVSTHITKHTH